MHMTLPVYALSLRNVRSFLTISQSAYRFCTCLCFASQAFRWWTRAAGRAAGLTAATGAGGAGGTGTRFIGAAPPAGGVPAGGAWGKAAGAAASNADRVRPARRMGILLVERVRAGA